MSPSVSYRSAMPTTRQVGPFWAASGQTGPRRKSALPRAASFVLALPLSVAFWVGLLVWWLA